MSVTVIEIRAQHLTGTGLQGLVMGFRCVEGRVKKIFQQDG
jgi:hypothetical protein